MLLSLSIRNYILIDELELVFQSGLCVITGETGSGKSILLEAILFCLGAKSIGNIVKSSAQSASVSAVFSSSIEINNILEKAGIDTEQENEIVVKRVQSFENKKKYFINDQMVTQKIIDQIADCLFEIHGQNNHTTLLNISEHLNILDNYSDLKLFKESVGEYFRIWQNIKHQITEAVKIKDNVEREIDYLTFVVDELSKACIKVGDEEKLANIRRDLQGRDKEIQLIQDLINQLEHPELDNIISKSLRIIARSNKDTIEFTSMSKNLDDAYNSIEEARQTAHRLMDGFTNSEYNLEHVEEKLFEIRNLARKYNITADHLPDFLNSSKAQLTELKQKIIHGEKLSQELQKAEHQYYENAKLLSQKRAQSALKLEIKVQQELALLKMERAIFKIEIISKLIENSKANGMDDIRFVASTNPGQPLAPIDVVASGGELSRFMLAFRTALFDKTLISTIIFDEVDTGIGGAVAEAVGDRLKKLSKATQVLVITHQPQVAAQADQHFLVKKVQSQNQTTVSVSTLSKEERSVELARMISGKKITQTGIKAAEELLNLGEP